ncbi:DUF423 domain-containing protein [Leeuwenhoekiella sp. A16]|uniref:DUF423 domain-containing protein n=1 Tax=unclassified Leeuwenhoekiella TaxID=2615029 RepID=UPI003A80604F
MEILLAQIFGSLFGFLAIIFGAFGAHALKKKFTADQLNSFETGVKYQMYHAVILVVLGLVLGSASALETYAIYCFIIGTFLFSFSIYGLCISAAAGKKWKFLGPVTPLGGLFLAAGWFMLLLNFI